MLIKKVIPEAIEDDFVKMVVGKAKEDRLTITNIRELTERVIVYMENNSVLPGYHESQPELSLPEVSKIGTEEQEVIYRQTHKIAFPCKCGQVLHKENAVYCTSCGRLLR